jgi:hypothetical protein
VETRNNNHQDTRILTYYEVKYLTKNASIFSNKILNHSLLPQYHLLCTLKATHMLKQSQPILIPHYTIFLYILLYKIFLLHYTIFLYKIDYSTIQYFYRFYTVLWFHWGYILSDSISLYVTCGIFVCWEKQKQTEKCIYIYIYIYIILKKKFMSFLIYFSILRIQDK